MDIHETEDVRKKSWVDILPGPLLAAVALGVYWLTLSDGAFPGLSAGLIAERMGLVPDLKAGNPLWSMLGWVVARLPVGTASMRFNAFSMLCGAVAVWLMYHVVCRVIWLAIRIDETNVRHSRAASILAGIGAALFLAFCRPFWAAANRASTGTFHAMLLLVVTAVYLGYVERRGRGRAMFFAFLYGLGVVEYAAFIPLALLFGLHLIYLLWHDEQLGMRRVLGLLLCAGLGLSMYFFAAWHFVGSEGYVLREYGGFWQVLWYGWRDQYWQITRSLSKSGWLLVVVGTIVPWLTALTVGQRALNGERDWSYYLLHVVMSALAICVLLSVDWWEDLFKGRDIPIAPYLLAATAFGYLIAYWLLLPSVWVVAAGEKPRSPVLRWVGLAIALPALAISALMPRLNADAVETDGSTVVNTYSRMILDSLDGRKWLITEGLFDNNLLVAAAERGCTVELVDLSSGRNPVYLRYLRPRLPTARLRNLTQVGMVPMLREWLRSVPGTVDDVAILPAPDLWVGAGFTAVPSKTVFLGAEKIEDVPLKELLAEHTGFWSLFDAQLTGEAKKANSAFEIDSHMRRHTSMIANNLGVLMQDGGMTNEAFMCYRQAEEIHPGNVSALLNQKAMIDAGFNADQSEAVLARLKGLLKSSGSHRIWMLARYHGYVRTPEAFAGLGWTWARSGMRRMAGMQIRRAINLAPQSKKGLLKGMLAGLQIEGEKEESETLYYEILVENPKDVHALLGIMRIAASVGDIAKAEDYLAKAKDAGATPLRVDLEAAGLALLAGKLGDSEGLLLRVTESKPDITRAWAMLGVVATRKSDERLFTKCLGEVRRLAPGTPGPWLLQAEWSLFHRDFTGAREALQRVLQVDAGNRGVLEQLLDVCLVVGPKELLEEVAKALLAMDQQHAAANYVMGSIRLSEGRSESAEDFLRASLQGARSPYALNDLAWLLLSDGKNEEGAALAREAIGHEEGRKRPEMWDTLGVALIRLADLEGAEKALKQALSISQANPELFVSMAELEMKKGNREKARELVGVVSEKDHLLPRETHQRLLELKRQL